VLVRGMFGLKKTSVLEVPSCVCDIINLLHPFVVCVYVCVLMVCAALSKTNALSDAEQIGFRRLTALSQPLRRLTQSAAYTRRVTNMSDGICWCFLKL